MHTHTLAFYIDNKQFHDKLDQSNGRIVQYMDVLLTINEKNRARAPVQNHFSFFSLFVFNVLKMINYGFPIAAFIIVITALSFQSGMSNNKFIYFSFDRVFLLNLIHRFFKLLCLFRFFSLS